jgi:hypothetical protein
VGAFESFYGLMPKLEAMPFRMVSVDTARAGPCVHPNRSSRVIPSLHGTEDILLAPSERAETQIQAAAFESEPDIENTASSATTSITGGGKELRI